MIGPVTSIPFHRPLSNNRRRGPGSIVLEYFCLFDGNINHSLGEWCQENELVGCEAMMQQAVDYADQEKARSEKQEKNTKVKE